MTKSEGFDKYALDDKLWDVRVACPKCGVPPFMTCSTKNHLSHLARKKYAKAEIDSLKARNGWGQ